MWQRPACGPLTLCWLAVQNATAWDRQSFGTLWSTQKVCHVISGFRRNINEIFTLLGCYAAWIGSYRRFVTTPRSHLPGSSKFSLVFPLKLGPTDCSKTSVNISQRSVTPQNSDDLRSLLALPRIEPRFIDCLGSNVVAVMVVSLLALRTGRL